MIYLDNSATTFPKPHDIFRKMSEAFTRYGANPGRSGYPMAIETAEKIYECRVKAADFFGADKPENVIFTLNCTHALNIVINGVLKRGNHVVCSDIEHNAVMRPIYAAREKGVSYSIAKTCGNTDETVRNFSKCAGRNTKLIICTHASNVSGDIMPIRKIGEFCRANGILFAVDAAQSAGILNIDMKRDNIDYLCVAPHKGLYAPLGTGMLIVNSERIPDALITGGTGSLSAQLRQPDITPDRFESGTVNVPGIMGISEGIDFVRKLSMESVRAHEYSLMSRFFTELKEFERITLHTQMPLENRNVPIIELNIEGLSSERTAALLAQDDICVRAGLHCAPLAHRKLGTFPGGSVRFSPSVFTCERDIDKCIESLKKTAVINKNAD